MDRGTRQPARALVALGGSLVLAAAVLAARGGDLPTAPRAALALLALAWIGMALGTAGALRAPRADRVVLAAVFAVAAGARLAALFASPGLSDDVYRFLWDGRVLLSGRNPYAAAPLDPALASLRDASWALVNHKELVTIYPPLAELLAGAAGAVAHSTLPFRAALILLDLALCGVLARVLADRGRAALSLLYAWNPLAIVETAGSGHVEPLATLPLVLALALLAAPPRTAAPDAAARGLRRLAAGALLGLSVLAKYGALLLVPLLTRRLGWRGLAASALVVAAGFAPFLGAGGSLFSSLRVYAEHWESNGMLFPVLLGVTGSERAARAVAAALVGVVLVACARERSVWRGAALVFGAALAVSPTVHPWYVLWVLPLAVATLGERRFTGAWAVLAWSGTAFLAYEVIGRYRATGVWQAAGWVWPVEYGPVLALAAVEAGRGTGARRAVKGAAWRVLRAVAPRLPPRVLYALGGAVGLAQYAVRRTLRARLRRNVSLVYGRDASASSIERIVRGYFRHRARFVLEGALLHEAAGARLARLFECRGAEILRDLVAARRGVVIPLIHFGPFTLAGARLGAYGLRVTNVAQAPEAASPNPLAQRLSAERYRAFEDAGGGIVLRDGFLRPALEALRAGEGLSLFFDAPPGRSMTTVSFLGLPLRVHAGPAAVALRTGAPILLMAAWRERDGRVHMEVSHTLDPVRTGDQAADVQATMQRIADYMAGWARRFPDQWLTWKELDEQLAPSLEPGGAAG